MPLKKIISTLFTLLLVTSLYSQKRGFKNISIKVDSSSIHLYDQSYALIIGLSEYSNGWPNLPGVKKDVITVKSILEERGFHVIVKENITKEEIDEVFVDFIAKYGQQKNNRLLFYFAGHGHTLRNFGETIGYIVPSDSPNPNYDKTGFKSRSLPISRIEEYAKEAECKHFIFLFDACFSGALFALTRAVPEVITYKTSKPVRQFITSGSANETVPDQSIFRQQLVLALTTNYADANDDGYLTGSELGKFLQDNVINYSKNAQHPQFGKIRNPYLDKGDFVFVIKDINMNEDSIISNFIEKNNENFNDDFVTSNVIDKNGRNYNEGFDKKTNYTTDYIDVYPNSLLSKNSASQWYDRAILFRNNGNYLKAISCFKKAAEKGNSDAQYSLGIMYYNGNKVNKNYKKALFWLTKASTNENYKAQSILGDIYLEGKAVKKDKKTAKYWYKKACENGNLVACEKMKKMNNKVLKTIVKIMFFPYSLLLPI